MSTTHYKRLQMELDVRRALLPLPELPPGYAWAAWHPVLAGAHAQVKCDSFHGELDADVFELLADLPGCRKLVTDISHHQGFVAAATWLIRFEGNEFLRPAPVATIQGIKRSQWVGNVQNVGVVPGHRGCGLGRALMLKCLRAFRDLGVRRVRLEVTAANRPAVRLYESLGFRLKRATYRSIVREPELERV
jgi:GNAT superfamily N-acetyltransferase